MADNPAMLMSATEVASVSRADEPEGPEIDQVIAVFGKRMSRREWKKEVSRMPGRGEVNVGVIVHDRDHALWLARSIVEQAAQLWGGITVRAVDSDNGDHSVEVTEEAT